MKKSIKLLAAIGTFSLLITSCNLKTSSSEEPKPVTYTITWKNYDGKVLELDEGVVKDSTPTYDGLTPNRESDAQFTYTFQGWTPEVKAATADAEYVATYKTETNKYTVTWKNENGTVLKTEDVFYGTTPVYQGETPTKDSTVEHTYTFEKWTPDVAPITGNTTYVASFKEEARKYNVTWKNADGSVLKTDSVPYGAVPMYGETAPTQDPTAQYSYVFASWTPNVVAVTGDAEYTATYNSEIRKYTVTWTNHDGTVLEVDSNVPYGDTPEYNGEQPARANGANVEYTFKGWSPEVGPITGDTTFVADYNAKGTFIFDLLPYELEEGYTRDDLNGAPWINANIKGEIDKIKKPSLKDDFYTSLNYDAIKNGDGGIFGDCSTAVSDAFEEIFTGQTDEYTTNGAAVKYIYDHIFAGNVDKVKEYFNGFDASEYLKSKAIFSTYNSPATIKKVGDTYEVGFNDGYMNGKYNTLPFLWIFSDTQQVAKTVTAILSSVYGLSMNTVDINNILNSEYNIVNNAYSDYYQYGTQNANYTVNTIPWTQLKSALIDLGLNANDNISIKKYYINSFNALFNNIDSAISRNMVLSRIAFDYRFLTGGNNYRSINQAIAPVGYWFSSEKDLHTKDDDGLAKGMARAGFTAIFEQTYIEIRSSEELKAEVAELIDDVLEAYIEMADNSWIAASSTRNAMKKKLQYMTYISCYSDFYKSFAKLGADGIGYQNVYDLTKLYSDASLDLYLSDIVDDSGQFSTYPSYIVNAFYSLNTNSFVILNGLAYGMSGETIEEKFGMLAMVIGHEITHAFDSSGSQFDENGNQKDWFSFMDKRTFNNKVQAVINYYDQISLKKGLNCSGNTVNTEATADMGGMKVALMLASKVENFNYDKFFRAYAYLWLDTPIDISAVDSRAKNEHPFNYLRVNAVVSQFDEFIETYDIKPGDGMYVPEEQRIKVW